MAWPQACLCFHINIKTRSGKEASEECEANKTDDLCSHVFCLSSVQKNVKKKKKVVNTSSVCQQPVRQTTNTKSHTHTHMLAAAHHTYRRQKRLQIGSQTAGRDLEKSVLSQCQRDWTCCARIWYCSLSTARWNQSVW